MNPKKTRNNVRREREREINWDRNSQFHYVVVDDDDVECNEMKRDKSIELKCNGLSVHFPIHSIDTISMEKFKSAKNLVIHKTVSSFYFVGAMHFHKGWCIRSIMANASNETAFEWRLNENKIFKRRLANEKKNK